MLKNHFINLRRETSLDTVKTLLAYGYIIEPPSQDIEEGVRKHTSGKKNYSLLITFFVVLFSISCILLTFVRIVNFYMNN
jgi:hypothetical protein